MEITKEFIDTFLQIVNKQADSKVRSKPGYGTFKLNELFEQDDHDLNKVEMNLEYTSREGQSILVFRKKYYLQDASLEEFRSHFYNEIVDVFLLSVGPNNTRKLISDGI
jgi:hypothetical protein